MSATLGPTPAAVHVQGEENAGEFPPPPAFPRCQAVVLACIDFQFVEPLHNFLRSRDLVGDFDLVSWPGGAVALGTADRGALLDAVALACDLHRPNELFLIVHHDCGRLGGSTSFAGHYAETATLDTALDIAHEVTAARFPELDIHTVRLGLDGSPALTDSPLNRDGHQVSAHGRTRHRRFTQPATPTATPPTSSEGTELMNRLLLAELQRQDAYPCVTLLLTTTPGSSMAPNDLVALTRLADSADRRLEGDVPDGTRRDVIDSIRALIGSSVAEKATKAIAVFASPHYSAVVRLADVTRDRVVIDNTFATRDLVADANRTALYRVITLSDHKSRVFIGDRARMVEQRTETWPLHRDDDQSPVTWARTVMTAVAAEHTRLPLPTVVAGVNRTARDLAKATNIDAIGIIRGNHDRTSWVDLYNQAWPLVCDWLRTDNQRALDHIDTARGANRYAGGVNEVWELAHDARVDLVVVEETYAYPARLCNGHLVAAVDIEAPDVIDDAIDELIEIVLNNGGRVAIVPDGKLADHDRLAAVLRY